MSTNYTQVIVRMHRIIGGLLFGTQIKLNTLRHPRKSEKPAIHVTASKLYQAFLQRDSNAIANVSATERAAGLLAQPDLLARHYLPF